MEFALYALDLDPEQRYSNETDYKRNAREMAVLEARLRLETWNAQCARLG